MGIDILTYAEKKVNNSWKFFMPEVNYSNTGYCSPLDVGGRIPALFQILSKLYSDEYGEDFKTISDNRGVPVDTCEEVRWYMEDLYGCSYVTLKEIMDFNWDAESEEYGRYRDIVSEEFFNIVVKHMQSALSDNVSEDDVRIVFGYST